MRATDYSVQTSGTAVDESFPMEQTNAAGRELHPAASTGFAQTFGLHPGMALLIFVVDTMLFSGEVATGGALLPFSCAAAVVLGVITFLAQRKWYGDDAENAFIKALILAFLTAIPTALPAFLYVPAGIVGLFNRKGR